LFIKKDSITNKLLQITEWLKINQEKISFEDSYQISISILKTLALNLLVILFDIFILNLFILLNTKGFIQFLK
jgi:hypothetical protein